MSSNNPQNQSKKALIGLIAGIVALAGIIAAAKFVYNRDKKDTSESDQLILDEIRQAKEEAEKQAGEKNPSPDDDDPSDADTDNTNNTSVDKGNGQDNTSSDNSDNTALTAKKEPDAVSKPTEKPSSDKKTDTASGKSDKDASESDEKPYPDAVKAPDFTVYTKDGSAVKLSDMRGKPVILNFWATWCGPCKMEMPHFEKAYKEYKDKIEFMMINPTDGYNDTHKSVDKFINDNGYTFPVYRDTKSDAITKYGISAFPTTFFIDSNGYLLGYYTGTMNEETLYACIDIVLGN